MSEHADTNFRPWDQPEPLEPAIVKACPVLSALVISNIDAARCKRRGSSLYAATMPSLGLSRPDWSPAPRFFSTRCLMLMLTRIKSTLIADLDPLAGEYGAIATRRFFALLMLLLISLLPNSPFPKSFSFPFADF